MRGEIAEFETNIRRECQLKGIAKAKVEGRYFGRKPTARAKSQQVLELIGHGLTKKAVGNWNCQRLSDIEGLKLAFIGFCQICLWRR